jgi:hypothetical protein
MRGRLTTEGGAGSSSLQVDQATQRYVDWFHELDAWTEYWDIYHPETRGRFYFGDGEAEAGLLKMILPRESRPAVFAAWTAMALGFDGAANQFMIEVRTPEVRAAVMEINDLLERLFDKHFGDAADPEVQADYLEAMFRFGSDTLPPAAERTARIPGDDPRKTTAGRHAIEGDLMWFGWALELEAARTIAGQDRGHPRRQLLLAGVAVGCAANFTWRGHRRTRREYRANELTAGLLRERGMWWATDFESGAQEVHALYRIREWGHED